MRAIVDTYCGGCPALIVKGEPMQEWHLGGVLIDRDGRPGASIDVKRPKVRCMKCADEPAPDLPVVVQRRPEFLSQSKPKKSSMAGIAGMARDWKIKQAGE